MPHYKHTNLTDEELLALYQTQRDKELLGVLLQRYTRLLLGVAMKYLKEKHLAEDAVQQIFLKVLQHLPEGEIVNFKGWLYVLMRNHCLQMLRNKNYLVAEEQLQHLTDTNEPNAALEKEFSLTQMHLALKELSREQQNTLELFYLKKQSYQQIMEQTGFTFMQVKSYIQNGKRNLKIILQQKINERQP